MKRSDPPDSPSRRLDLSLLGDRLSRSGLALRGGFDFCDGEASPRLDSGKLSKAVVLIGNIGGAFWPVFGRWREDQPADLDNPLDTWSRAVIEKAATGQGAKFISPSDQPFMPFQQWSMRAEGLRPSPLGILMHPEWGLWHAYRGALLFDQPLGFSEPATVQHLCDTCADKPCLRACPVGAYSATRFDYAGCVGHVRSLHGGSCRTLGCLDRNGCPYGIGHRYPADMQAFIMRAYAGL